MRLNPGHALNTAKEASSLKKSEYSRKKYLVCQAVRFRGVIRGALFSILVVSLSRIFRLCLPIGLFFFFFGGGNGLKNHHLFF